MCLQLKTVRLACCIFLLVKVILFFCCMQPVTEDVKKELTDRDVREGFDITLTKHRGQV